MRFKLFGLAALAAALMAVFAAGTASAAIIESSSGTQYKAGTSIAAEAEGTTEFHPPIGSVNCKKSTLAGTTSNDGGAGVNVTGSVSTFTLSECNGGITILIRGFFSFSSLSGSNGTFFSTSFEFTIHYLGFTCIYKTNNTKIGTVTGGSPATLDIEATLPRTGGASGAFCGSTAQWTGSYKFTSPTSLLIT